MPAYLAGTDRLGLKWVSGYTGNAAAGLPYIYGLLVMNDADSGRPIALMDGAWITEMRTPGVSGVAMRHTPGDVKTTAVIGCGVQGRRHLTVALEMHPEIDTIVAFDQHPAAIEDVMSLAGGRRVVEAKSPQASAEGADLVITSVTTRLDSLLRADGAAEDAIFLPLDYDDAIGADVVNGSTAFIIDDPEQYASVLHRAFRGFRAPDAELADVVAGRYDLPVAGRRVLLNMGLAMNDVALEIARIGDGVALR